MDLNRVDRTVSSVASVLEQSALQSERFEDCFNEVAAKIGSNSFHLCELDGRGKQRFLVHENWKSMLQDYYSGGWQELDVWSVRSFEPCLRGEIAFDHTLISPAEVDRDPYFQEYCKQWNARHFSAFAWKLEGQLLGATIIRPKDYAFTAEDALILELLRPRLVGAAAVASALRNIRLKGLAEGLELAGRPSVILDHQGKVLFMSAGAERLRGSAFQIVRGEFSGFDSKTDANFRKVFAWIRGQLGALPNAFPVCSPYLPSPIYALPFPLRDLAFAQLPGATALVMFVDPSRRQAALKEHLIDIWGLTGREADLAYQISLGATLKRASEILQLKESTIRQMHKTLLQKSGVSRQAELAVLLSQLSIGG